MFLKIHNGGRAAHGARARSQRSCREVKSQAPELIAEMLDPRVAPLILSVP
jgi:hypothetical protein